MIRYFLIVACAVAANAPRSLSAQSSGSSGVPDEYKPPAGMCRIWVDNVKPDKQPAPTDCASAIKNKPTNGRVIFGDPKPVARPVAPPPPPKTPPDTSKAKPKRGRG